MGGQQTCPLPHLQAGWRCRATEQWPLSYLGSARPSPHLPKQVPVAISGSGVARSHGVPWMRALDRCTVLELRNRKHQVRAGSESNGQRVLPALDGRKVARAGRVR